ncbi:hypothetical protein BAXH7_01710 [Bacillus amyloliquefaciens XH7]|nr:hypothetical protein LL3_01909 [Bacillus amyloliquefaciens LL3]AEK88846.1 hypothetical protein BAXH7_01710 [Bacillus amyloliquefaciens XH7]KYC94999.1 hypothetical protein B425_1911 [Bacillus amyloliquefaciens]
MECALKNILDDEERLIIEKKYLTAGKGERHSYLYGTWHEEGYLL